MDQLSQSIIDRRLKKFWVALVILTAVYVVPLLSWATYAWSHDLHSHCVLVPFISIYLLRIRSARKLLLAERSLGSGVCLCVLGAILAVGIVWAWGDHVSDGDRSALWVSSYLLFLVGLILCFFGRKSLRKILFPIAFLVFLIPLPEFATEKMESLLMVCSAEVSHWFFTMAGTPTFREGQVIELPGIVLEVARECSGIRATWVLFITSILAAHLFLRSSARRLILIAMVFPLGVLRNALRILVIGQLCVLKGPEMIDHWIHRRGGPVFFGISLIPLFLLMLFLWRNEQKRLENTGDQGPKSA